MASLEWFLLFPFTMFTNKATIFLDDGLYRKISVRLHRANENTVLVVRLFSQLLPGNIDKGCHVIYVFCLASMVYNHIVGVHSSGG